MEYLFDLYKELSADKLSFIYNGEVSDDITEGIIRISDYNLNNIEEVTHMRKRVSFIMMECFQNIVRHGKRPLAALKNPSGLFSTRLVGTSNFVSSVNLIDAKEIDTLRKKLHEINTLPKDKLKALHLDVLNNRALSAKGGAGLGLIEIARKTGQPLGYDFESVNDTFTNFYLSIKLSPEEQAERIKMGEEALRYTKDFDKRIRESDILIIYKGDFGKDSIMPIISILEEKMKDESASKALYVILVEMLQNVSRHALDLYNREGIFLIRKKSDGHLFISVGNVVNGESKQIISERIEALNKLDAEQLKVEYKRALREGGFGERGGAGLGLIEIARKASAPMQAIFDPLPEGLFFFTFNVTY